MQTFCFCYECVSGSLYKTISLRLENFETIDPACLYICNYGYGVETGVRAEKTIVTPSLKFIEGALPPRNVMKELFYSLQQFF